MNIRFSKYHGTGNDFILIDNRNDKIELTKDQVAHLCHRRFGIGADGLMLLENETGYDFRMVYYNADGGESTMCGNGGRCIVAFAKRLNIIQDNARFVAIDGPHEAVIHPGGDVSLHMQDVQGITRYADHATLNTGSPHYVLWTDDLEHADVFTTGRNIRNREAFQPGGINVNFVKKLDNGLAVRTYERGVEDETWSCGTGVTAAAIAASNDDTGHFTTPIKTPGGHLEVSFTKDTADTAREVILKGPAVYVFEGEVVL